MKKIAVCLLGVVGFALSARSQCPSGLTNVYSFTYGGKNYEVVKEKRTWVDAAACAVLRGGKLAEIDSQPEQDTVFYQVNLAGVTAANTVAPDGGGASYLWLGGNDLLTEGKWIWDGNNDNAGPQFWQGTASGTPVGGLYNNWGNEPDDFSGQDALGLAITDWPLGTAGEWNDLKETNLLYYVIEYPASSEVRGTTEQVGTVALYPNPVTNEVILTRSGRGASTACEMYIINLVGQVVVQRQVSQPQEIIDLNEIGTAGIYVLQLRNADGSLVFTGRLIKQ